MLETSSLPPIGGIGPSWYIELPAIVSGALSGGAHAVCKGFDAVGVVTLAIVTGLGGGFIRDVILGHTPPVALATPSFLLAALLAGAVTFFLARSIARAELLLGFIDAAALGFFGTAGAQQALAANLPPLSVVFVGVVSAIGGGILRDVLANDVPAILAPGTLHATVAAIGVSAYVILIRWVHSSRLVAEAAAIGITLVFRRLATWGEWHGPVPPTTAR
jgi:uncharacterized membrane protein YeiH